MAPQNSSPSGREPVKPASEHTRNLAPIAPANLLSPLTFSPVGAPPHSDSADLSGAALLQALRRRLLQAVSYGLVAASLAVAAICLAFPPKYTAQALIHVASRTPKGLFSAGDGWESNDEFAAYQRTQAAWLKSRPVAGAALQQPSVSELATVRDRADAVDWLEKSLQVDTTLGPEILRLTLSGDRPEEIAAILNAVAHAYLQEAARLEQSKRQGQMAQLQENYHNYQDLLRRKQSTLKELEETLGADDPQTVVMRFQSALTQLATAEKDLLLLRLDLKKTQWELAGQQEREKSPQPPTVPELAIAEYLRLDPVAIKLQARVHQLDEDIQHIRNITVAGEQEKLLEGPAQQRAAVLESLVSRRTEVRPLLEAQLRTKALDDTKENIAKLEGRLVLLQEQEKALATEVQRLEALVKRLTSAIRQPDKPTSDLERLRAEVIQSEATLKRVADQLEIWKVEPRIPPRATLLEAAEAPHSKNVQLQIKLAGTSALGVFAIVAFGICWRESRARRVYAVEDVVSGLGMSLVGTLPALPAKTRHALAAAKDGVDPYQHNPMTESIDAIRALLLHAAQSEALQVVMVTSATGGEGKTSLATLLATSLARAWRKTVLIDGDLRNPAAHRPFDLPLEPGFSEMLRREVDLNDVVRPTPISRLWVIPAGNCDPFAIQALAQKEVRALFERLKEQYDFIVIDSSPVLPVADALSLGRHADGVILSVLRHVSRVPAVRAAHDRLTSLGIRMLGTVVIGTPDEGDHLRYQYPVQTAP
jgi:capsular exopolysaccharide synthesis family protein